MLFYIKEQVIYNYNIKLQGHRMDTICLENQQLRLRPVQYDVHNETTGGVIWHTSPAANIDILPAPSTSLCCGGFSLHLSLMESGKVLLPTKTSFTTEPQRMLNVNDIDIEKDTVKSLRKSEIVEFQFKMCNPRRFLSTFSKSLPATGQP